MNIAGDSDVEVDLVHMAVADSCGASQAEAAFRRACLLSSCWFRKGFWTWPSKARQGTDCPFASQVAESLLDGQAHHVGASTCSWELLPPSPPDTG